MEMMPTAAKRKPARRSTLRGLGQEISSLRARVEDLEDLRDLNGAIARNNGRPGTPWDKVKRELNIG
jgi:hypothetical protein